MRARQELDAGQEQGKNGQDLSFVRQILKKMGENRRNP